MLRDEISRLRQNYNQSSLNEATVSLNAIEQFEAWFKAAADAKIFEYNAMTLATSSNNVPDARIVLLKSFNNEGFVFFTNYNSSKGRDLAENPKAALVFLWKELERQVRIRGNIKKVSRAVSETYFASRPKDSQCGAIASAQSSEIASRGDLEKKFLSIKEHYTNRQAKMPEHWGGYILEPVEIEFWQGREGRMHDRLLYSKNESEWNIKRLQP